MPVVRVTITVMNMAKADAAAGSIKNAREREGTENLPCGLTGLYKVWHLGTLKVVFQGAFTSIALLSNCRYSLRAV
jgi:hypothetical protein